MEDESQVLPSDKLVETIEELFVGYSGFRPSANLRNKITKAITGKSRLEVSMWVQQMKLTSVAGLNELQALTEDLTNHETFFFRDMVQYTALSKKILPKLLLQKKKSGDKVFRIWSAACSTGEEAYSLAIVVVEFMLAKNLAKFDVYGNFHFLDGWSAKVYGTDISRQVVSIAKNGIYHDNGMTSFRSFPKKYKNYFKLIGTVEDRLFKELTKSYQLESYIQNMTNFDVHNLNQPSLPTYLKEMDVIFSRNLLIYLNQESQLTVQKKFNKSLSRNGFLVLSAVDQIRIENAFVEAKIGEVGVFKKA